MEMEQIFGQTSNVQQKSLISISDVILGLLILALMVLFLLVSISYSPEPKPTNHEIQKLILTPVVALDSNKVQPIMVTQSIIPLPSVQETIYQALLEEFKTDLSRWFAKIDKTTLTIRFQNTTAPFEVGYSSLNSHYQVLLAEFFPRYVKLLRKYKQYIEALSIEGHTSSEWRESVSQDEAYFNNMNLSQKRTRAVLEYCLQLPSVKTDKAWLRRILTANGLSSSRLIIENNLENIEFSRRVEFRIYIRCE